MWLTVVGVMVVCMALTALTSYFVLLGAATYEDRMQQLHFDNDDQHREEDDSWRWN